MNINNKTIVILFVVADVVVLIIVGALLGVLLTKQNQSHIELEVWPRSADDDVRPFIQYKSTVRSSWYPWILKIDDFLKEYRIGSGETHGAENRVACNPSTSSLGEKQVCDVPVDHFHPCTPGNQYNYAEAAPCVFLKLNKILDWKPQTYNLTDLPVNMPMDLKQHIRMISGKPEANTVWVSCEGENPADVENIGPVQYIPRRGFPAYYYPFTNKEGYLSPLVAVLFETPRKGVVINIECKAWAKNIYENGGSVHFKLMVE